MHWVINQIVFKFIKYMNCEDSVKLDYKENSNKYYYPIKRTLSRFLFGKTQMCKHHQESRLLNSLHPAWGKDLSCFFNGVFGFIQAATKMFMIKSAITLLLAIAKRGNLLKSLMSIFSKDSFSLSLYWGLMISLYKFTIWVLRWINKTDDKINSIIAGIVSSLSTFADRSEERRIYLILFFFARSIETSINYSNTHNTIKIPDHIYVAMYSISCSLFWFLFYYDQTLMKKSLTEMLSKSGRCKKNELIFIHCIFHEIESRFTYNNPPKFDINKYQSIIKN